MQHCLVDLLLIYVFRSRRFKTYTSRPHSTRFLAIGVLGVLFVLVNSACLPRRFLLIQQFHSFHPSLFSGIKRYLAWLCFILLLPNCRASCSSPNWHNRNPAPCYHCSWQLPVGASACSTVDLGFQNFQERWPRAQHRRL